MIARLLRLAGLLALILMLGCSKGPRFAPVEGKVTRNGKALNNVRVEFWPETDGPKSTGITDDEGHYSLKTEDGKVDGAVVGNHRVIVKDMELYGNVFLGRKAENMPTLNKDAKVRFSKSYSDPATTSVKKTVEAGEGNKIDLELK